MGKFQQLGIVRFASPCIREIRIDKNEKLLLVWCGQHHFGSRREPLVAKLKRIREPEAGESPTFGWAARINGAAAVTWAAMWAPSINWFVQFPYVQQFAAQRALAALSFIGHRRPAVGEGGSSCQRTPIRSRLVARACSALQQLSRR